MIDREIAEIHREQKGHSCDRNGFSLFRVNISFAERSTVSEHYV